MRTHQVIPLPPRLAVVPRGIALHPLGHRYRFVVELRRKRYSRVPDHVIQVVEGPWPTRLFLRFPCLALRLGLLRELPLDGTQRRPYLVHARPRLLILQHQPRRVRKRVLCRHSSVLHKRRHVRRPVPLRPTVPYQRPQRRQKPRRLRRHVGHHGFPHTRLVHRPVPEVPHALVGKLHRCHCFSLSRASCSANMASTIASASGGCRRALSVDTTRLARLRSDDGVYGCRVHHSLSFVGNPATRPCTSSHAPSMNARRNSSQRAGSVRFAQAMSRSRLTASFAPAAHAPPRATNRSPASFHAGSRFPLRAGATATACSCSWFL